MAANFNRVILMGNLTRDPEIRYLPSGSAVADFGMAINRKYRTKDGQEGEETCFVDVSAWGRQGEVVAQYVSKGSPLFVEGRLKLDQWEKDGQKRSKLTVVAERVQLMSSPRGRGGEFQDNSAPAPQDTHCYRYRYSWCNQPRTQGSPCGPSCRCGSKCWSGRCSDCTCNWQRPCDTSRSQNGPRTNLAPLPGCVPNGRPWSEDYRDKRYTRHQSPRRPSDYYARDS